MQVFPVSFYRFKQCLHNLPLLEERRRCLQIRVQQLSGLLFFKCVYCCFFCVLEQLPELAHHHPLLLVLQRRGR